jgi:hypothetical protein
MRNNVHMALPIPPTKFHYVTGTWTQAAGQVAGTIAMHKAAAAETTVVTIPVEVPTNAIQLQGSKIASIEVDFEVLVADCTSLSVTVNKVTRGADTAVATVTALTQGTLSPALTSAKTVEQHKLIIPLATQIFLLNTEILLVALTFVCPATTTLDILGAVVNFAARD